MASIVRQVSQCRNCTGSQSAARTVGMDTMMILDVKVSPITPRLQNTKYHDSSGLVLHAITAVDWLEPRIQWTRKQPMPWCLHTLEEVVYEEDSYDLFYIQTIMHTWNRFATNSHKLAGSLTTVWGGKVFGKQGMAGTLEEAVFRLLLYIVKHRLGSKLISECIFGAWQLHNFKTLSCPLECSLHYLIIVGCCLTWFP